MTVAGRWAVLLLLSAALAVALESARMPAALFLGPMLAAIAFSAAGGRVRIPPLPFYGAQAVLGCLIGRTIPASILGELLRQWPLFLLGVFSVIAAAGLLGWLLTRWRILPGTSAVWGISPGAATAMVLMADAYGADARLVAVMQYLRVICAVAVASLVARLWVAGPVAEKPAMVWFPAFHPEAFAATLAVAAGGALLARRLRIPAGPLLLPLVAGAVLQNAGLMRIELPPLLLAVCYALVAWTIGLRFDRGILTHALRALPRILASILALILVCGLFAAVLVEWAGVDPLTAYLATSPGGADTVAIIAASTKVDVPFVMAMQTARLVLVLLVSPRIARFIAERL
ncbi:MAG TPA: AbrB family transcriptional regulator [Candidatus Sulfotelmatobacter sp.]|jgi:membrane AbrB-like protein|nr:AbrB family transcriptional regulator [Candidatus Sulfotelmatobacter sp.]